MKMDTRILRLGRVVATPAAIEALTTTNTHPLNTPPQTRKWGLGRPLHGGHRGESPRPRHRRTNPERLHALERNEGVGDHGGG